MEQVLDKNLYLNDLAKIKETIKKNQSNVIYIVNSAILLPIIK